VALALYDATQTWSQNAGVNPKNMKCPKLLFITKRSQKAGYVTYPGVA